MLRQAREGTRLPIRQQKKVAEALERLENHSQPRYKLPMAWGWGKWQQGGKGYGKAKQNKGRQWKEERQEVRRYDGKRLQLPSSSQHCATEPMGKGNGETQVEKQLRTLRTVVTAMTKDTILPPELKEALEGVETQDKEAEIKERQRELNMERKRHSKVRMLQQQMEKERSSFAEWKMRQKELIKSEEQRHKGKMEELQEKLQQAQREAENGAKEEEMVPSGEESDLELQREPQQEQQQKIRDLENTTKEMAKAYNEIEYKFTQACQMYQDMQKMTREKEREAEKYKQLWQQHVQITGGDITTPVVSSPQKPLEVQKQRIEEKAAEENNSRSKREQLPRRERSPRGAKHPEPPKPKPFGRREEPKTQEAKTTAVPSSQEEEGEIKRK